MKQYLKNGVKLAAAALVCALPFLATESQAVPAFARQTGMVCTTCHIGQDNVPNFTRTARIFQMRGYFTPTIRERIRGDGQTIEGEPQYGGDYLSVNMMDFFSARFVSELAQQSKVNGVKSDVTSTPAARMSLFFTGPITDWLGLWTEIGYLANNSLNSVTVGNTGPTNENTFAFDEFRLATSRTINENSFIGMSIGNEPGDVVSEFLFPLGIPRFFSLGQGGVGKEATMSTLSLHGFFDDQYWVQFAAQSGVTNNSFSNGWQQYYAFGWNALRQTENDLWLAIEYSHGNDNASILTPNKMSFICPTTCPAGVTDSSLSFTNTLGGRPVAGAPVEVVNSFNTYSWRIEHTAADRGPHSWVALIEGNGTKQNYASGASARRDLAGVYLRYYYLRTYGFQASWYHDFKYEYTGPTGAKTDFGSTNGENLALLWSPAMNFSVHLNFNFPQSNAIYYPNGSTGQPPPSAKTSSWNLGFEYNF
ncbi:MAG TPA: hypothetical protein VH704_05255 [Casimicrobiaceae bacterium]|jgi:hypothetical protein|nr:hypothetical protein [Casimicrobiaceae bacterium]